MYNNFQTFRSNMTLTPHPDKEELIMFGGEFLTGSKVYTQRPCHGSNYTFVKLQFFFIWSLVESQNCFKLSYCIDRIFVQKYL